MLWLLMVGVISLPYQDFMHISSTVETQCI